jgi:hypothetical protein
MQNKEISNRMSQTRKDLFAKGLLTNPSTLEHNRKKSSERMKGNDYGSFRKMTDELKEKLKEKSKGNTNVRGTKWWTNGITLKRSKECPGKDYVLGTKKEKINEESQ